jgi:hypothetical protein
LSKIALKYVSCVCFFVVSKVILQSFLIMSNSEVWSPLSNSKIYKIIYIEVVLVVVVVVAVAGASTVAVAEAAAVVSVAAAVPVAAAAVV